jgi:endothelin-converting enzyme
MSPVSEKSSLLGPMPHAQPRTQPSRRRSILALWLTVLALFCTYLLVTSYLVDGHDGALPAKEGKKKDDGVCLTPACVHASSELLYNLSPSHEGIDACKYF